MNSELNEINLNQQNPARFLLYKRLVGSLFRYACLVESLENNHHEYTDDMKYMFKAHHRKLTNLK